MTNLWFSCTIAFVLVIPEPATFALALFTAGWFALSALQAAVSGISAKPSPSVARSVDTTDVAKEDRAFGERREVIHAVFP